jgi:hypothetical protein
MTIYNIRGINPPLEIMTKFTIMNKVFFLFSNKMLDKLL